MASRLPVSLLRLGACLAAACAVAAPAAAGTLQVDPIRLEIGGARRTATLRVHNQEQAPVTIRAYPLAWTQAHGEDVYEESGAVIVSPPVFTIPAGGTQLVRIGLRSQASDGRSYRVIVEEVPEASNEGVQVALRLNLPLFASVARGAVSDIEWSAFREPDGRWVLEAANRGSGYVRIEPADAAAATGLAPGRELHFGVVLPGSTRRWSLGAAPPVADRARFATIDRTDAGQTATPQPLR